MDRATFINWQVTWPSVEFYTNCIPHYYHAVLANVVLSYLTVAWISMLIQIFQAILRSDQIYVI